MKSSVNISSGQEAPSSFLTKITVLGATGSIGLSTLDIVRQFPQKFQIEALSCKNSTEQLAEQIKEFGPRLACVDNSGQAQELQDSFPNSKYGVLTGHFGIRIN